MWRIVLMGIGGVTAVAGILAAGLVGYAAASANGRLQFPDTPSPPIAAVASAEIIEQGRYLVYGPAHCASCHSTSERAHPEKVASEALHGGLAFEMGPLGARYARNLTPDITGIGSLTDAQVARAIRTGVTHEGELSFFMRFSAAQPSDEDLVAILSYLRSVEPVPNEVPRGEWYLFGKVLLTYAFGEMAPRGIEGPTHVPYSEEPSVERGAYLVDHLMLCTSCHTAYDPATFEPTGPAAGGGTPEASHGDDSHMEFAPPNLTSHPTGITGQLDEDGFVARLRGGRKYASSIMPWENFAATSESDLRSVYRYLRSLPPVDYDGGPSYRPVGWAPVE